MSISAVDVSAMLLPPCLTGRSGACQRRRIATANRSPAKGDGRILLSMGIENGTLREGARGGSVGPMRQHSPLASQVYAADRGIDDRSNGCRDRRVLDRPTTQSTKPPSWN